jgi:hypothetical protein
MEADITSPFPKLKTAKVIIGQSPSKCSDQCFIGEKTNKINCWTIRLNGSWHSCLWDSIFDLALGIPCGTKLAVAQIDSKLSFSLNIDRLATVPSEIPVFDSLGPRAWNHLTVWSTNLRSKPDTMASEYLHTITSLRVSNLSILLYTNTILPSGQYSSRADQFGEEQLSTNSTIWGGWYARVVT